ncbi:hypothetical protein CHELA20_54567 [Hyphomicrobiales bacterium]|nr:hypothetical protein CHELA20_54567 [Hyphomicrobiales bacterium]
MRSRAALSEAEGGASRRDAVKVPAPGRLPVGEYEHDATFEETRQRPAASPVLGPGAGCRL